MTAKELHDAIAGLPEEATCQTIRFNPFDDTWFAILWPWSTVRDDHAEALHRDAMTEWLLSHGDDDWDLFPYQNGWRIISFGGGRTDYPSRTLALIAAVRYVSGEVKA